MCASDLIASGVLNELNRLNKKVPEEISVVGFDDLPLAEELTPSLTTIRQDRNNLGKSAALMLDGLIRNTSMSKLLLRAKLVVRESSARALQGKLT